MKKINNQIRKENLQARVRVNHADARSHLAPAQSPSQRLSLEALVKQLKRIAQANSSRNS